MDEGEIFANARQLAAHIGELALDRRHARAQFAELATMVGQRGADGAQLRQHEVFGFGNHGRSGFARYVSTARRRGFSGLQAANRRLEAASYAFLTSCLSPSAALNSASAARYASS